MEKMTKFDPDSTLFAPIKNIVWDIDENLYSQSQKQRMNYLEKQFSNLMHKNQNSLQNSSNHNNSMMQREKFSYYSQRQYQRILNKQESQQLVEDHQNSLKRLVTHQLEKDDQKPLSHFENKTNLDNFGIQTGELQEFFQQLNNRCSYLQQVIFYLPLLEIPKFSIQIETLKQLGFNVYCLEDLSTLKDYKDNTLLISFDSNIVNCFENFSNQYNQQKKVNLIFIYKTDGNDFFKAKELLHGKEFVFFENFTMLVERIITLTRYVSYTSSEEEAIEVLGIPYTFKKQSQCFCPKHLQMTQKFSSIECLEIIFNNYKDQFSNQKNLKTQIQKANTVLGMGLNA